MSRYEQEWHFRKVVMEAILDVLRDARPRTAKQILHSLLYEEDLKVDKTMVNSILSSEAKRYVIRDYNNYTYRIRPADELQPVLPPWPVVSDGIRYIIGRMGPLSVNELMEQFEDEGVFVPKWMIRKVISDDSFRHSA